MRTSPPRLEETPCERVGQMHRGQQVRLGKAVAISNRAPVIKAGEIVGAVDVFLVISDLESVAAKLKVSPQPKVMSLENLMAA
jgi:hypothetical protein